MPVSSVDKRYRLKEISTRNCVWTLQATVRGIPFLLTGWPAESHWVISQLGFWEVLGGRGRLHNSLDWKLQTASLEPQKLWHWLAWGEEVGLTTTPPPPPTLFWICKGMIHLSTPSVFLLLSCSPPKKNLPCNKLCSTARKLNCLDPGLDRHWRDSLQTAVVTSSLAA